LKKHSTVTGAGTDFPILITARYYQNQISGDRLCQP